MSTAKETKLLREIKVLKIQAKRLENGATKAHLLFLTKLAVCNCPAVEHHSEAKRLREETREPAQ